MSSEDRGPLTIEIARITFDSNTGVAYVSFVIRGGGSEKKTLAIPSEKVGELDLKKGYTDAKTYERVESEAKSFGAYRRGMNILGYGANSKKTLERKLQSRGFDRESAMAAVARLEENGYVDEGEDAYNLAEREIARLSGEKRVYAKLREKGYAPPYPESIEMLVDQTDFTENCVRLIKKKYGTAYFEKKDSACEDESERERRRKEKDRIVAGMIRYGYSFSQIKEAFAILARKAGK